MRQTDKQHQRGFTLVELMVAMVVALLILAGILQILLGNRRSFDTAQTTAALQENARLASFVIENAVAQAGYRVDLAASDDRLFPASSDDSSALAYAKGAVVAGKHGAPNENDELRLRLQAAGGAHDCAGKTIAATQDTGQPADNSPKPAIGDFALLVEDQKLRCIVYPARADSASLVRGVERLKVRYGLDTDNNGSVDQYTSTLTDATAAKIRSLRIQILLQSNKNAVPSPISRTYRFADGTEGTYTDRRARVLLDQTIALQNMLP